MGGIENESARTVLLSTPLLKYSVNLAKER